MKWFVQLHKLFPLSTHSYMQCFTGGAEAKVILDDNMMVYSKNRCILLLYDSPGMTCTCHCPSRSHIPSELPLVVLFFLSPAWNYRIETISSHMLGVVASSIFNVQSMLSSLCIKSFFFQGWGLFDTRFKKKLPMLCPIKT